MLMRSEAMMRHLLHLLIVLPLLIYHDRASAQGCSDAGVCTAGPIGQPALMQDSAVGGPKRHYVRLQYSYAIGEQGVAIMQVVPELSIGLTDRLAIQAKLPYVMADGDLGQNSGIGDLVATASYRFIKQDDRDLTGVLGMRIPTGRFVPESFEKATYGPTAHPLPMPYQVGLGTTDLLFGLQYRYERISAAIAYQHVLKQDNQSTFLHRYWADVPAAASYFESFALERADDAVLRLQYGVPFGRLILQPGLLGILHMGKDSRLEDPNTLDLILDRPVQRREIDGSEGLTLNLTADLRYQLNSSWWLEASMGSPLVVREVRPDGLTRALVANMGLRFAF